MLHSSHEHDREEDGSGKEPESQRNPLLIWQAPANSFQSLRFTLSFGRSSFWHGVYLWHDGLGVADLHVIVNPENKEVRKVKRNHNLVEEVCEPGGIQHCPQVERVIETNQKQTQPKDLLLLWQNELL